MEKCMLKLERECMVFRGRVSLPVNYYNKIWHNLGIFNVSIPLAYENTTHDPSPLCLSLMILASNMWANNMLYIIKCVENILQKNICWLDRKIILWYYTQLEFPKEICWPIYAKILHKYHHTPSHCKQYSPYPYQHIIYGQKVQKPTPIDNTPALNAQDTKYVQQVIGALLYYARAIDCTMLVTLSKLSHMQSKPTQLTLRLIHHLLDYCATNPDATIRYTPSDMILKIQSDSSYLSEPKARSRCGGHFYLGSLPARNYTPNGAILNSTNII